MIFLSTPSARRATQALEGAVEVHLISIHALREEGDCTGLDGTTIPADFYPRPPRGGRPSFCSGSTISSRFLSTPSARRATKLYHTTYFNHAFLSTPSARRATPGINFSLIIKLFLSTPSARRATRNGLRHGQLQHISIHALREEGDSLCCSTLISAVVFLSTPSARRATPLPR